MDIAGPFLAGGLVSSESVLYNHHTEQTIKRSKFNESAPKFNKYAPIFLPLNLTNLPLKI